MKKVGILGGTFDPPHIGHLIIANEILQDLKLDEVRFMPNQNPPHKEKTAGITGCDRIKMLTLAISGQPAFSIEAIEMERPGRSYTYDTMVLLKKREPDTDFYFIIGADMIEYLPKWRNIDQLVRLVRFVGVNRPAYSHQTKYPVQFVEIPEIHISSSLIRERLEKKRSVKYLIPDAVWEYIKEHHLYGT
ncbi:MULTISPECIES: nicotinate-nucleotide adenylyltransferase [Heyndrickxia]|nr:MULTISPECIES: nicotinate-nucleotide adenylyltransferase [Heyndrickxia]AJH78881.1 nicotinate (nicotinamide) nucleotide adenylyltransferase [Heyndrickxia coagulans DSM 1 = ATCC 7050]MBF8419042.1 nicotinate-nucleotide adenylyltransferase [Heyndrickxia coagulans]MBQ4910278.1 nicotinate-nucleotide adenylyltransferase [Heyndrickxia faecalis]MCR2845898.1 nicotinate-nucleotide adenylyltransferase [Heyndrickxia coagulans]MDR4223854.1 nicotinate-nucleotide adenylyltransferase [Heyndrickxia coagulans 